MITPGQSVQTSGSQGQTQSYRSQEAQQYLDQQITNIVALPFLDAIVDQTGEPVKLIAACNWANHSPANIGVRQNGKQFIAGFEELTVTDDRAVPNLQAQQLRTRQPQPQRQLQNQ